MRNKLKSQLVGTYDEENNAGIFELLPEAEGSISLSDLFDWASYWSENECLTDEEIIDAEQELKDEAPLEFESDEMCGWSWGIDTVAELFYDRANHQFKYAVYVFEDPCGFFIILSENSTGYCLTYGWQSATIPTTDKDAFVTDLSQTQAIALLDTLRDDEDDSPVNKAIQHMKTYIS